MHDDLTPEQYVEAVLRGEIDLEADRETLEVLHDPEAMAAITEDEAGGDEQVGRS